MITFTLIFVIMLTIYLKMKDPKLQMSLCKKNIHKKVVDT